MDKVNFKTEAYRQLVEVFKLAKINKPDAELKARTEGFMFAGQFLELIDANEGKAIIEQAHFDVFAMTVAERAALKAEKKLALETLDEAYLSIPAVSRQIF